MRGMTTVFRSLLVWLMLVALPLQGVASASMMACAPLTAAPSAGMAAAMAHGEHDHAAMLAAQLGMNAAQHDGASEHDRADSHDGHAGHGGAKCGVNGACCIAAAMPPPLADPAPAPVIASAVIPFRAADPAVVYLAGLERPPQLLPA